MKGVSDYVLVYDITEDRERRRVEKLLKGYGFRAQKSVFECRLNRRGKEEIIEKLKALELKTGFVKLYRLEYSLDPPVIGKCTEPSIDDGPAFVV